MPPPDKIVPTASHGVFSMASAVNSLTPEQAQKFYYATTQRKEYCSKDMTPEARGEEYGSLYNMGKQFTKFMPVQISETPNHDRSITKHSKDFTWGTSKAYDFELNKDFCAGFGPKRNKTHGDYKDVKTQYLLDFPGMTPEQMGKANQPNMGAMAFEAHSSRCIAGGLRTTLETAPLSHDQHAWRHGVLAAPRKSVPQEVLCRSLKHAPGVHATVYNCDFGKHGFNASNKRSSAEKAGKTDPFAKASSSLSRSQSGPLPSSKRDPRKTF